MKWRISCFHFRKKNRDVRIMSLSTNDAKVMSRKKRPGNGHMFVDSHPNDGYSRKATISFRIGRADAADLFHGNAPRARIALARHSFGNRQVSQSGKPHLQRKKPLGSS